MSDFTVAELIARARARDVGCLCELAEAAEVELLDHQVRGQDEFERVACRTCGVTFRRVWVNR